MKIKSIKLTSEHEVKNVDPKKIYVSASKTPTYQIEYEETTPTGLKATGFMLLEAKNEEKVDAFFKELETILTKKDETEEANNEPSDLFEAVYSVCLMAIEDADTKKATDFANSLSKALSRCNESIKREALKEKEAKI